MLVGQTVNAWTDPATGRGLRRALPDGREHRGLERLTFHLAASQRFQRENRRRSGCRAAVESTHSHADAVGQRCGAAPHEPQVYCGAFHEKVELVRRYLPQWAITTDLIVGFPGESDDDFERTLDYVRGGVFANAFTFMYSIRRGTPAAHWEQVPRDMASARFARLLDAQNAVTRAYHDAKIGGVVRALVAGPSKKDDRKLAARALDNVTIVAPMPDDYDEALYAREPWIDVAIETAHVWGCSGTIVRRAARYAEAGRRRRTARRSAFCDAGCRCAHRRARGCSRR